MSRWFRLYDEVLDDPKVQRLAGDEFKAWVNLLCLASRNDGELPDLEDIAFALRLDAKKAAAMLARLVRAGLVDDEDGRFSPHAWNERQYKSDVSTDRVKRFRERKKGVAETHDETFRATPPETDTETEVSEAKASAQISKIEPEKVMFDHGTLLLVGAGKSESAARSILGKWKRDHGAAGVIAALGAAQREGAIDPVGFIEGRFRHERKAEDEGFAIGGVRMNSPC